MHVLDTCLWHQSLHILTLHVMNVFNIYSPRPWYAWKYFCFVFLIINCHWVWYMLVVWHWGVSDSSNDWQKCNHNPKNIETKILPRRVNSNPQISHFKQCHQENKRCSKSVISEYAQNITYTTVFIQYLVCSRSSADAVMTKFVSYMPAMWSKSTFIHILFADTLRQSQGLLLLTMISWTKFDMW